MNIYNVILIATLIYSSIFLFTVGLIGVITQTPVIYRFPYIFHRPSVYLLILGVLFFDPITRYVGEIPALLVFVLILIDLIYESIRPFISHAVEIGSATPDNIRADLVHAFKKLNIRYEGSYPSFNLPDDQASLRVKYWGGVKRAKLTINPNCLLLKTALLKGKA